MYYVYILKSEDNNITYVGMTSKAPEERLAQHHSKSSQFTRSNSPWVLKYYESFTCKKCAAQRELFFKSGVGRRLKEVILREF